VEDDPETLLELYRPISALIPTPIDPTIIHAVSPSSSSSSPTSPPPTSRSQAPTARKTSSNSQANVTQKDKDSNTKQKPGLHKRPSGRPEERTHKSNLNTTESSAGPGKNQRHKNSAARCRDRLHSLLETLWDTVPESERNRLRSKDNQDVGTEISRAEKIGIVVAYIRTIKAELYAQ